MSSFSRQQLEAWLRTLDVDAGSVLDIGGSQYPIKGRTRSWNVGEYKLFDLAVPHEVKKEPDFIGDISEDVIRFLPEDCRNFDCVFMIEVVEYLWDPIQALRNCNFFLKLGGKLYLSYHFLYPIHKPIGTDFMRFTPDGITKMLEMAGFQVDSHTKRVLSPAGFHKYVEMSSIEGMKRPNDVDIIGGMVVATKI